MTAGANGGDLFGTHLALYLYLFIGGLLRSKGPFSAWQQEGDQVYPLREHFPCFLWILCTPEYVELLYVCILAHYLSSSCHYFPPKISPHPRALVFSTPKVRHSKITSVTKTSLTSHSSYFFLRSFASRLLLQLSICCHC